MPRERQTGESVGLEQLDHMLQTAGWQMFEHRVKQILQAKINELQMDAAPDQTATLRGLIRGLKCALLVPQILQQEIAERARKHLVN